SPRARTLCAAWRAGHRARRTVAASLRARARVARRTDRRTRCCPRRAPGADGRGGLECARAPPVRRTDPPMWKGTTRRERCAATGRLRERRLAPGRRAGGSVPEFERASREPDASRSRRGASARHGHPLHTSPRDPDRREPARRGGAIVPYASYPPDIERRPHRKVTAIATCRRKKRPLENCRLRSGLCIYLAMMHRSGSWGAAAFLLGLMGATYDCGGS